MLTFLFPYFIFPGVKRCCDFDLLTCLGYQHHFHPRLSHLCITSFSVFTSFFFFFSPLKKVSESSDLFDRNIILRIGSSLTNHRNTFKKPCLFPTRQWAVIANTVVLCTYLIVWINHVNMTISYEFTYVLFYMLYLRFLYCRNTECILIFHCFN